MNEGLLKEREPPGEGLLHSSDGRTGENSSPIQPVVECVLNACTNKIPALSPSPTSRPRPNQHKKCGVKKPEYEKNCQHVDTVILLSTSIGGSACFDCLEDVVVSVMRHEGRVWVRRWTRDRVYSLVRRGYLTRIGAKSRRLWSGQFCVTAKGLAALREVLGEGV